MLQNLIDFLGENPLFTMLLIVVLFFGGCSVAIHFHVVSSSTKLMPY